MLKHELIPYPFDEEGTKETHTYEENAGIPKLLPKFHKAAL